MFNLKCKLKQDDALCRRWKRSFYTMRIISLRIKSKYNFSEYSPIFIYQDSSFYSNRYIRALKKFRQ